MPTTTPETIDSAALAAMREAFRHPRPVSQKEKKAFDQLRARAWIRRFETLRLIRRGALVFRINGRGGADLPCYRAEWENQKALQKFQRLLGRVFRRPPKSALGVRSRQATADARAQRVLALQPLYQHRGRAAAALIARKLDEPAHYVRRILRENVHDPKSVSNR